MPGFRLPTRYEPASVAIAVCFTPRCRSVATTEMFGTAAPVVSRTVPEIDPRLPCAATGSRIQMIAPKALTARTVLIRTCRIYNRFAYAFLASACDVGVAPQRQTYQGVSLRLCWKHVTFRTVSCYHYIAFYCLGAVLTDC